MTVACGAMAAQAGADAVDSIQWSDSAAWACARRVAIKPLPVLGDFKGNHSIPEYTRIFADELGRRLRSAGIEVVLASADPEGRADVIV